MSLTFSTVYVFGDQASTVVDGRSANGAEEPAIAAARFRKGRMVALTGYPENDAVAAADTSRMMLNIGRWAAVRFSRQAGRNLGHSSRLGDPGFGRGSRVHRESAGVDAG